MPATLIQHVGCGRALNPYQCCWPLVINVETLFLLWWGVHGTVRLHVSGGRGAAELRAHSREGWARMEWEQEEDKISCEKSWEPSVMSVDTGKEGVSTGMWRTLPCESVQENSAKMMANPTGLWLKNAMKKSKIQVWGKYQEPLLLPFTNRTC